MSVRTSANNQTYTRIPGTFAFIPLAPMPFLTNMTVCGWFRLAVNRGATTTMFGVRDSGNTGTALALGSTNGTATMFEASATDLNMITMVVGSWYFMSFTALLTGGTLAMNAYWTAAGGGLLSSVSGTDATITTSIQADSLWIGSDVSGNFLNGNVQYLKLWDAILTQAELQNEVFHGQPQRTANLNASYPLLAANTAADGNGTRNAAFEGGANNVYVNAAAATTEAGPPCSWI